MLFAYSKCNSHRGWNQEDALCEHGNRNAGSLLGRSDYDPDLGSCQLVTADAGPYRHVLRLKKSLDSDQS